jgi:glyceraldehyde 3-phosphate dehydrogenase
LIFTSFSTDINIVYLQLNYKRHKKEIIMRVAINGMGRIGRLLFRRLINHPEIELVAVNDIMDSTNLHYLIKYDSIYGAFYKDVIHSENSFVVEGQIVKVFQTADPAQLPWKNLDVDVVLECSGQFNHPSKTQLHFQAGAKKVLLSTTGAPEIPLMIYVFNHTSLTHDYNIISPGGCMTNCTTHLLHILDTAFGIESAHFNILHSYTSRQELVDTAHKQLRRGRAAAESIIPVEIDLAVSLEKLFPHLQKHIAATSIRVPVANGALADCTFVLKKEISAQEINSIFQNAANTTHKHIIACSDEGLVSIDIKGNKHSCIIDTSLTSSIGKHIKLHAWFDNEYGYTSRMIDWLLYVKHL